MPTETVLKSNDIETVAPARVGDTLGYARVSTHEQNPDAQSDRLIEAGAIRVFTDIVSGKRFDRPALPELIDHARPGDRLCIIRLDRLGRSLRELLETVDGLKARGIHLVSLEERLDTSSASFCSLPPGTNRADAVRGDPLNHPAPIGGLLQTCERAVLITPPIRVVTGRH